MPKPWPITETAASVELLVPSRDAVILVSKPSNDTMSQSSIVGFHLDDEQHWVAELACGHFQHVRHVPPWTMRPWVTTAEGRASALGQQLDCKKCDRNAPSDHI